MSSLQCPATLLLAACADAHGPEESSGPGATTGAGRGRAETLARRVSGRRVASVWSGADPPAVRTSEVVAAHVGCRVTVRPELGPVARGEDPGRATARLRDVLQEIADLHRGETVLVVTDGDLLALAVPRVAATPPHPSSVPPAGLVELAVDEEWWCRAWDSAEDAAPDAAP